MFTAWWFPFSRFGVIHGDPHLGNYTVFQDGQPGKPRRRSICSITAASASSRPKFVGGVVDLYRGLLADDDSLVVHAYETWGFKRLTRELIDALNIWARFIYGPLLDDRVRTLADGVKPSDYGRRQAFQVHQALKERGPVTRAARIRVHGPRRHRPRRACFCIWRRNSISTGCSTRRSSDFSIGESAARQIAALAAVGLEPFDG